MPYKNALSPKKPHLDVNSSSKSSISATLSRLTSQFYVKLGLTTSLFAIICLPNSTQAVDATDLGIPNKDTASRSYLVAKTAPSYVQKNLSLLPRIFSVIAFPAKPQLVNLSRVLEENSASLSNRANNSSDFSFASQHFNTVGNLANASSNSINQDLHLATKGIPFPVRPSLVAKAPLQIYTVKPGDTIHQIAKRYQVSSSELAGLNKINNSNVIFVNQRLMIPAKVIETQKQASLTSINTSESIKQESKPSASSNLSTKVTQENYLNSPKLNSNKVNSVTPNDPYITKLRAEIEQTRTLEQNRPRQTSNTSTSSLPSLPSANHSHANHSVGEKDRNTSKQINLATSAAPQYNLKSDSLSEEIISLQLPPLPPSEEYLPSVEDGYIWPAQGVLTSAYGWRWGRMHQGIDIAAPVGTPILAAASGEAIGAGWHSGYGNLIKLKHPDGSITLYAHINKILVSHGQKVVQGEQIAEMGSTGRSTGSHLHFEIHPEGEEAIDPLVLLGSR